MVRLADLRKQHSMTQADLAKQLKVSKSAVALWESGKRIPTLSKAISISALFNVNVEEISFNSVDLEVKRKG